MYDAREKASLDIQSNLIDARQEGRQVIEETIETCICFVGELISQFG